MQSQGRVFIIGNGPSLRQTPLHELEGEMTFACNRIGLANKWTDWRSTHYFAFDFADVDLHDNLREVATHVKRGARCFVNAGVATLLEPMVQPRWPQNISYHLPCPAHADLADRKIDPPTDWHLPYLCDYGSTIGIMIQVAVLMKRSPIYLIGCDLGYTARRDELHDDENHFDPAYDAGGRNIYRPVGPERDELLIDMHSIALRECQQRDVEIYNATIGGVLEVYPRTVWGAWNV